MVYATLDAFVERGMPQAGMHSDIFSFAPSPDNLVRGQREPEMLRTGFELSILFE